MKRVAVSSAFNEVGSQEMLFLRKASLLGEVHVLLWADEVIERITGKPSAFPIAERLYMIDAVRYVASITVTEPDFNPATLPEDLSADIWAVREPDASCEAYCSSRGIEYVVLETGESEFPVDERPLPEGETTVIVTGCYDWFHSGHVRFFEEVSEFGKVYVVVGNDENVRLLKGEGHPMFSEQKRRFICDSIKFVHQAFISSGEGWLDAEPEIKRLRPDRYAVNEDGDKPEKREFCEANGIEYVVLKRVPKEGLTRRSSTDLRGF